MRMNRGTEFHADYYKEKMDSSLSDKERQILPYLLDLPNDARVLSLGAGTGSLERTIAHHRPDVTMVAIDYDESMLADMRVANSEVVTPLSLVQADATKLPFVTESFDAIVASSINHEIASFSNHHIFGKNFETYLAELLFALKIEGRLIIRDFAAPQQPWAETAIRIGNIHPGDPVTPLEFLCQFAYTFKGLDTTQLRQQIHSHQVKHQWQPSAEVQLSWALAYEVLLHFSWAFNFEHEVKERYCYLDAATYADMIEAIAAKHGMSVTTLGKYQYTQAGYEEHVAGRLDLIHPTTKQIQPFIATTQLVVIQKTT